MNINVSRFFVARNSSPIAGPFKNLAFVALVLLLLTPAAARAAIITAVFAGIPAPEQKVINAAIEWWGMALPDPGLNANPVVVTFQKAPGGIAGTLPTASTNPAGDIAGGGVAGTLFAGRPAAATLTYNNAAGFFYVDPTPHTEEATEFTAVATADPNGFDDVDTFFSTTLLHRLAARPLA